MERMIIAGSGKYRVLTPEEYYRREAEWLRKQLQLTNPKPSGALAMWAWHTGMQQKFSRYVGQERPVRETQPTPPSQARSSSFSGFYRKTAEKYPQSK